MRQKFFTVTDCFKISGRGTAIVGNHRSTLPNFEIGDAIILVLPNGQEILTTISNFDTPITVSGVRYIAILVENITKNEVLIGTEVFLK